MRRIFIGSDGIRAGWRFLIFVAIITAESIAFFAILHAFKVRVIPPNGQVAVLSPWTLAGREFGLLWSVVFATWVMSKIERRRMPVYGWPWRPAFERRFWAGALTGIVAISVVVGVIFLAGGARLAGVSALGAGLLSACVGFTIAFVLVGCSEEFMFRGYPQFTLTRGIGFWPAAVLLSLLFAAVHTRNPMESPFGLFQVFVIGMVFALMLERTGNLWFPIGFHAAWDWGQTFFFGVPDSGLAPSASFLHVALGGPAWLSGGADGPEGSVFATVVVLLTGGFVAWRYPRKRYRIAEDHSTAAAA